MNKTFDVAELVEVIRVCRVAKTTEAANYKRLSPDVAYKCGWLDATIAILGELRKRTEESGNDTQQAD